METVFNNGGGSGSGAAVMDAPRIILPGRAPVVWEKPNIPKHFPMFANEKERALAFGATRHDNGMGYTKGEILFANENRLSSSAFQEPLVAYAVGWPDPTGIRDTLNFVCPEVPVARRFEWKKGNNVEFFLSETDDLRDIGSDFKKVEFTQTSVTDKTLNKGLTYIADLDELDGIPNWRERKTALLTQRLYRNELRRAITLLSAAATNTAKTWDTTAGKDPDQDVLADLITGGDLIGFNPNRIIYGLVAWQKRWLSHRAQNTAGGFGSSVLTPDQLAASLMVDAVRVSKERYSSSSTARTQILNNLVISFMGEEGVGIDDPSSMKRFVSDHSAEQGGGRISVYEEKISQKMVALTVSIYSQIVVTTTLGIRQFTIS